MLLSAILLPVLQIGLDSFQGFFTVINLVYGADAVGLEEAFQSYQVERFIVCYQDLGTTTWLTETLLSLIDVNDVEVHQ